MSPAGSSYEVQLYLQDHWVLDARFPSEAEARGHARRLLSGGRVDGVRVIRDWLRADGRHVETELHQEFRALNRTIAVAPLDEAPPPCQAVADLFSLDARIMMNRLLRNYVERHVVTPTELLHSFPELRRLADTDALLQNTVGRVAVLQAEQYAFDCRGRRDALHGLVDGARERTRKACARPDLPDVAVSGFAPAFSRLAETEPPEERGFLARVVLSRELVQLRNWLAKLEYLAELVRQDGGLPEEPLAVLDGAIADVLGAPSVVQALLGAQGSLGDALCSLIDLARGRLDVRGRQDDDPALHLNELLAFHDLAETRIVLLDILRRQLRGTQPLHRHDRNADWAAHCDILKRLTGPDGLLGGPPMAEALVLRHMRFLENGGALGRRKAMEELSDLHKDRGDRVRFLLALADSGLGRQHAEDVGRLLEQATASPQEFERFLRIEEPPRINLEKMTRLYRQVADSTLAAPLRGRIAENIDRLLVRYITDCRVIERLDRMDDPLRHRANRLIQLCAPGILQSPGALALVRDRVIAHLRQPQFEQKYVSDLPDRALQQGALREFYRLLGQAGLR